MFLRNLVKIRLIIINTSCFFLDYKIGSNWHFLPYYTLAKKMLARVYSSHMYSLAITYPKMASNV
jgi:hypothetical protein